MQTESLSYLSTQISLGCPQHRALCAKDASMSVFSFQTGVCCHCFVFLLWPKRKRVRLATFIRLGACVFLPVAGFAVISTIVYRAWQRAQESQIMVYTLGNNSASNQNRTWSLFSCLVNFAWWPFAMQLSPGLLKPHNNFLCRNRLTFDVFLNFL